MSPLVKHLSVYAAYHRDGRNVATHIAGIPAIVVAVAILTSRPMLMAGDIFVTPAMVLSAMAALFYLRLDLRFGLVMAALLMLAVWVGLIVAALETPTWLAIGLSAFVGGWILQLVGHRYEGRKPAFLDDITGLIVGPLFIVAEIAFSLGLRPEIGKAIHRPTHG